MPHTLSKSTYIRGLQCEKSLYLYKHFYKMKDPVPIGQQAIFDQGKQVGILAQDLFPAGVDASASKPWEYDIAIAKTQDFIQQGETVIYEATFRFNNVVAAIDILVKDTNGWKAYEVKSSTSVSETYIKDAAIQYYILSNQGFDLQDISIVHINNQYVKNGPLDVHQLFTVESVLTQIIPLQNAIPDQLEVFQDMLSRSGAPDLDIGRHCDHPYSCDYKGTCWKHIPEYSVFDISRLTVDKKFSLYHEGKVTFEQLDPADHRFNASQALQVRCEQDQVEHIERAKIQNFLKGLNYPLYHLDFETIGPAVPIYDNTKPYEQTVFQYSLHVHQEYGAVEHFEYLAEADREVDPRIAFIEQLIRECGTEGDVIVYNQGFERSKLERLAQLYPGYKEELVSIINRMKDLMLPFQKKWYYHPAMKGSYSIKYVLPALVPELTYDDLEIQAGGTASQVFMQLVRGTYDGDYDKARKDLLEYCKLDTWAMVRILEKLLSIDQ